MIDLFTLKGSPDRCAQTGRGKCHRRWWDRLGDVTNLGKKQCGLDWGRGRGRASADPFHYILFITCLLCTYYVPGYVLGNADTMVNNTDEVLENTGFIY